MSTTRQAYRPSYSPDGAPIERESECNRHLTDETSRSLGIGPECRNK